MHRRLPTAARQEGRSAPRLSPNEASPTPKTIISAPSIVSAIRDEGGFAIAGRHGTAETVDVTIPVEREAAAALADARNREAVGRLVSRVLRPDAGPTPLALAIAEMKRDAGKSGVSDADIDAELARAAWAAARLLIVFDASTVVSAALEADSIPERALLRAGEVDVLAPWYGVRILNPGDYLALT